jgi:hypothetical protein
MPELIPPPVVSLAEEKLVTLSVVSIPDAPVVPLLVFDTPLPLLFVPLPVAPSVEPLEYEPDPVLPVPVDASPGVPLLFSSILNPPLWVD